MPVEADALRILGEQDRIDEGAQPEAELRVGRMEEAFDAPVQPLPFRIGQYPSGRDPAMRAGVVHSRRRWGNEAALLQDERAFVGREGRCPEEGMRDRVMNGRGRA